jgi:hypothetical protein
MLLRAAGPRLARGPANPRRRCRRHKLCMPIGDDRAALCLEEAERARGNLALSLSGGIRERDMGRGEGM